MQGKSPSEIRKKRAGAGKRYAGGALKKRVETRVAWTANVVAFEGKTGQEIWWGKKRARPPRRKKEVHDESADPRGRGREVLKAATHGCGGGE